MTVRPAFTLIEVAIAGTLIGTCVLTAIAIIPRGLVTQNEARMRAAAAAAVMTMSANSLGGNATAQLTTSGPAISKWISSGAVTPAPSTCFRVPGMPSPGALENRLVFTLSTGSSTTQAGTFKIVTAWLLNKDPDSGVPPFSARYLATFTEL